MRTLFRSIFILTTVLSVFLTAIISASYRNTNHWDYLFTNADGSRCATPCLFGSQDSDYHFGPIFPTLGELLVVLGKPDKVATDQIVTHFEPFASFCNDIFLIIRGYSYLLMPSQSEGACLRFDQEIAFIRIYDTEEPRSPVKWVGFTPNGDTYIVPSD